MMNTKIYNKVVPNSKPEKGLVKLQRPYGRQCQLPQQASPYDVQVGATTMLYRSKVSMYACEGEGVSTTAAEVRPR